VSTIKTLVAALLAATSAAADPSAGTYRLPFADSTQVKVFDDFTTHRPAGRIDFFAANGTAPHEVVAAADGIVMAIQDGFSAQLSGRAAKDCHNNYVWIAHPNGEWTNYSHVAHGTVSDHLKIGDHVKAGDILGDEGAVGCAMLDHVHFEVAVPAPGGGIDEYGFLLDNDGGKRERNPRLCGVPGGTAVKDALYTAGACP
jgi:murein DD-endopeptidase MepM/ murein hydrolase activator NlpD